MSINIAISKKSGTAQSAGIPDDVAELIAVDMGVLGEGLQGNEHAVSIYAKDSGDPFDLGIRRRLVAQAHGIPYKLDIYPFYGSDTEAALRLGALETLTTLPDWGLKLSAISNTVQPVLQSLLDCSALWTRMV